MAKYFEKRAVSRAFIFRAAQKAEQKAKSYTKLELGSKGGVVRRILDPGKFQKYMAQSGRFIAGVQRRPATRHGPLHVEHAKEMAVQARKMKVLGDPGKMARGEQQLLKPHAPDTFALMKMHIAKGFS